MSKMCKKPLLITELIFYNNPKTNGKIIFAFVEEPKPNFEVGLQKYAINAAFLYRENEIVGLYIAFVLKQIVKIL